MKITLLVLIIPFYLPYVFAKQEPAVSETTTTASVAADTSALTSAVSAGVVSSSVKVVTPKIITPQEHTQKAFAKLKSSIAQQIEIKFVSEKKVLGKKIEGTGLITTLQNKLNMQLSSDKKVELIFDGSQTFVINYPDQELNANGPRKVIKLKSGKGDQFNLLLNLFQQPHKVADVFDIKSGKTKKDILTTELVDKKNLLKPIIVELDTKKHLIQKLIFIDDVDSILTINLSKPEKLKKVDKTIFKYNAVKTDEVISQ